LGQKVRKEKESFLGRTGEKETSLFDEAGSTFCILILQKYE
jgi:hypothetical protein